MSLRFEEYGTGSHEWADSRTHGTVALVDLGQLMVFPREKGEAVWQAVKPAIEAGGLGIFGRMSRKEAGNPAIHIYLADMGDLTVKSPARVALAAILRDLGVPGPDARIAEKKQTATNEGRFTMLDPDGRGNTPAAACGVFRSRDGCRQGDRCPFRHE